MKLRDYNNSTPVKRKIKSPVVKLINNEVQTSKLENQIKDLTSDNKKYQELIQQHNELKVRFKDNSKTLEVITNERGQLDIQLQQQQLAQDLLKENNTDLRKMIEQIPSLEHNLQQITTERNELKLDNNHYINVLETFETNLTESQKKQEEQSIEIHDQNVKMFDQENKLTELTNLNTTLVSENSEYSKTLSLTLSNFKDLELETQQLINDNRAAREKIETLEGIKSQLDNWIKRLSKESLTTTSKSSALEQKLSDSTIVIEELGETVSYLLREKEELIEFNAALLTEVRKPRYFSTAPIMKRAGLPVASQAVHRKYMGLGSPTLLKFKREDGNDDEK